MHLILHLGPPKTGSTSIQRALWDAGPDLAAAGIHHFRDCAPLEWALHYLYSGHGDTLPPVLRRHFDTAQAAREWSMGCWDLLAARLAEHRPEVTVISSEHFANLADPAGFIRHLSRYFDKITGVAYARDPAAFFASEVDELIRAGRRFRDLPQVRGFRPGGMANLRRFEPLLGAENLVIRNFDRHTLAGADIVTDFFALLSELTGRDLAPPARGTGPRNGSLCGAATAWLLTLNEATNMYPEDVDLFRALTYGRDRAIAGLRRAEDLQRLPRLRMTDPVITRVLRAQADDTLAWLNARYLAHPIPRADPLDSWPGADETASRLRNWLMSYATPRAMLAIERAIAA